MVDSGDLAGMVVTVVITVAIAGTIILRGPLGRAIARAIEGKAGRSPDEDSRLLQLEHRVAELETAQGRVGELEERLDFAERLLTRPGAAAPGPEGR